MEKIKNNIKRFRIFDADNQIKIGAYNTTQEVYEKLKTLDLAANWHFVDCVIDDIEVAADEFMEAFDRGETPGDLTFF